MKSRGTKRRKMKTSFGAMAAILLIAASALHAQQKPTVLRVGYFPNITHAQALVGRANGQFEKSLGAGVQVEWKAFNAGPSAIEALFANAIDLTYVGPNPTVAGYFRSQGAAVPWWCAGTRESKPLQIFMARKSPRRNSATRRMWRCDPGCAQTASNQGKKAATFR